MGDSTMNHNSTAAIPLQFLALAAAWGASFLFIKVGLEGLSPLHVVTARMTIGALTLGAVCTITRHTLPRNPVVWGHLTVVTVLLCVTPFLLFAYAEQHISSGLASIYNATTPLMTMVVAFVALPQERLSRVRVIGLAAGFVGVIVVLAPWHGLGHASSLAQGACLLATISYGLAFVYLRRFVSPFALPAIPVAATQVGIGAILLLAVIPFAPQTPVDLTLPVVGSLIGLGSLGTGMAYVWNTNIVAAWGATAASSVTYLTPLVGVTLGVALLSESLTWNQPLGAAIVITGVAISHGRLQRRTRSPRDKNTTDAP